MNRFISDELWKFSQCLVPVLLSLTLILVSCKKGIPTGNIEGYIYFANSEKLKFKPELKAKARQLFASNVISFKIK